VQGPKAVTICIRTHSKTNPYRLVTMSQSAASLSKGRQDHYAAVYDPSCSYPAGGQNWGDIVPGDDNDGWPLAGLQGIGCNWNASGKAILMKTGVYAFFCR